MSSTSPPEEIALCGAEATLRVSTLVAGSDVDPNALDVLYMNSGQERPLKIPPNQSSLEKHDANMFFVEKGKTYDLIHNSKLHFLVV